MGKTKGPYNAEFRQGSTVQIADRRVLDDFFNTWKLHNRLRPEQLNYADKIAEVESVGFYHGGDELYKLKGVPGLWHESCLKACVLSTELVREHDRLFNEALEAVRSNIQSASQGLPPPDPLLTQKLRHALDLLKRVLQINPSNWSAMWFLGKTYQRLQAPTDALYWFEQSYRLNPQQPDVAREGSISAMEIGNHQRSIFLATQAVVHRPNDAGLHANMALAYLLAGQIADAQAAIKQSLVKDASDSIARTISQMIRHFADNDQVPPPTTPALLRYWKEVQRAGKC